MAPNIQCPYGERRGATVYCKIANRVVNALVFPCTSPRYASCKFYRQAEQRPEEERKEEMAKVVELERAEAKPEKVEVEVAPEEAVEPAISRSAVSKDAEVLKEAILESRSASAEKEAERLLDPVFQASLVLEYTPRNFSVPGRSIADIAGGVYRRLSPGERGECFIIKTAGVPAIFVKMCDGKVIAAASEGEGPITGEKISEPRFTGLVRVLVYGPLRGE
ncbi:MAG: hypothetical protein F7C09_00065 [Aeropyrum sp.]|nr:hypothetical protein [Aeropyrum sp.]